ncbi:MAG: EamA family transporter [Bryobacteraceae bacterium]|nr:EamA family transporter [Bryobacteraceae bacterium]
MRSHPLFVAYLAFASVCFFWGTTYLGIRMALETLSPLFLVSGRFLLSGGLLLAVLKLAGVGLPKGRELLQIASFGVLTLGVGNTCLTYSEMLIPSSLAALFLAVSPIWMVTVEALVPGGERVNAGAAAGIGMSLLGASLLVGPDVFHEGFSGAVVRGFLLLQLGGISWSLGSILQRRLKTQVNPFASAAIHQLAAGLFFLPAALMENAPLEWTPRSLAALAWLIVFGSIVGYTSYIVSLERLPVAIVSLHTYINPLVAAWLGWLFYREPFGRKEMTAMAVIFAGVAIVKRFGHRR